MKDSKNIMVCVTQQKTCERLIMSGYEKMEEDDNLFVINVVNEKDNFLYNSSEGEALEYLFSVSKKVGADLTVIRSKDVIKAIADFAKKNDITHIVLGVSPQSADIESHNIVMKLKKYLPKTEYIIV
ncbi:universal stress protein family [Gottschalkia purinilytica]|uniref:Universal stress protein family n=1 Tax=Gottschalkia purinilytica TaxID=1503 RepID=A0A0L0WD81_GOTPU|nr:universal stress protein UspA [Gottschalkia purinilytica]KNF09422.1 universal stress protein family [Gottschalkia purinilytica]